MCFNETEHVNLNVFNMITITNESKTLLNIFHVNVAVNLMMKNVM